MIEECHEKRTVLDYIGKDFGKCLYLYIDLEEYGLENDFFKIWIQTNAQKKITSLISKYYDGFQVFSKDNDLDEKELVSFIGSHDFSMIVGMEDSIKKLSPLLKGYYLETGYVGQLNRLTVAPAPGAYRASFEEIEEIAELLADDPTLGKPYGFDNLVTQYRKRFSEDFGRSYLLRDKKNKKIICHAATYAETKDLAVISGVITAPEYRGQGYSKGVLAALCNELMNEKKHVFSYYYIPPAIKMHQGTGFEDIGKWAKLVKNDSH